MAGTRVYLEKVGPITRYEVIEDTDTGAWARYEVVSTEERAEWRGLSQTEAIAQTPTADWEITVRRYTGNAGFWRVEEEKVVETWTLVSWAPGDD